MPAETPVPGAPAADAAPPVFTPPAPGETARPATPTPRVRTIDELIREAQSQQAEPVPEPVRP